MLDEAGERMDKAVATPATSSRPSAPAGPSSALVEKLPVDYYGTEVPLQQLAGFSVPEARLLVVNPFDKGVAQRHREGDPQLRPRAQPEQRRRRHPPRVPAAHRGAPPGAGQEGQGTWPSRARSPSATPGATPARSSTPSARDGEIGEDDVVRAEKELDRITHAHEADIDKALEQKEAELLEV